MYQELKAFGHLSNRDAAWILLSDEPQPAGGPSPRSRVTDRTFLSREVVHARPRSGSLRFSDLSVATLDIASRTVRNRAQADDETESETLAELSARYGANGPAAQAMAKALGRPNGAANLYSNALARIDLMPDLAPRDRGTLALMLFIAAGCIGDPLEAARVVDRYASTKLACDLRTVETDASSARRAALERPQPDLHGLSLLRLVGAKARYPMHPVSTAPEGSVVGTLADGPHDITDVDADVSRRHARIWRDQASGRWYVEGLGSTNGTAVISGDTREATVVEPPRRQRDPEGSYPPVELLAGDFLWLGASTCFMVMETAG